MRRAHASASQPIASTSADYHKHPTTPSDKPSFTSLGVLDSFSLLS